MILATQKKALTNVKNEMHFPIKKSGVVKVGVVTSKFNSDITFRLEEGALSYLEKIGVEIISVRVPGAVEIPLACKAMFDLGCDAIVALGAVIRGETSHYDIVCNSVERGESTHVRL